jgi:hypothetical protein
MWNRDVKDLEVFAGFYRVRIGTEYPVPMSIQTFKCSQKPRTALKQSIAVDSLIVNLKR